MQLGVDLGGTKIAAAVLDSQGVIIWQHRLPTPSGDYSATVRAIADLVQLAEQDLGVQCTVGVATPGSVSPTTGLMRNCNSTCLNDRDLFHDLQVALDRPIRMANDANCFALSEAVDGEGSNAEVVFGAILGTGVGGGVVINKQLLTGRNSVAASGGITLYLFSWKILNQDPATAVKRTVLKPGFPGPRLREASLMFLAQTVANRRSKSSHWRVRVMHWPSKC